MTCILRMTSFILYIKKKEIKHCPSKRGCKKRLIFQKSSWRVGEEYCGLVTWHLPTKPKGLGSNPKPVSLNNENLTLIKSILLLNHIMEGRRHTINFEVCCASYDCKLNPRQLEIKERIGWKVTARAKCLLKFLRLYRPSCVCITL